MKLDGWAEFNSYQDFKARMKFQALVQTKNEEEEQEEYSSALEDLDYFECKRYGKVIESEDGKVFYPFYGHMLDGLQGKFALKYRSGKIESIVLSPKVLCEWYERKGL